MFSKDLVAEPSKGNDKWNIFRRENDRWKEFDTVDVIFVDKNSEAEMKYGKIFLSSDHCELKEENGLKIFKCGTDER